MAVMAILALPALLLAAGQVSTPDDLPRLVKRIQPAVVTVIVYKDQTPGKSGDPGKILAQGTGFFITPEGRFVTNYHVLAKGRRAEVKTLEGRRYPVKGVVAADRNEDLVVAAIDPPPGGVRPLKISGDTPQVGERVLVVGSPLGLEQTLSDGVVSAVRRFPPGPMLQITAPISPGSSGSPVINLKGEVIGVARGTLKEGQGQNLNFAVPGNRLLALQEKAGAATLAATPLASLVQKSGSSKWYLEQGHTLYRARDFEKALVSYRRAVTLEPHLAEAHFALGLAHSRLGRHQKALEAYQEALRQKPDYAEAHSNLGGTYAKLGRHREAQEACRQALRYNPNLPLAHYWLGMSALGLGQRGAAREEYQILQKLDARLAQELLKQMPK